MESYAQTLVESMFSIKSLEEKNTQLEEDKAKLGKYKNTVDTAREAVL